MCSWPVGDLHGRSALQEVKGVCLLSGQKQHAVGAFLEEQGKVGKDVSPQQRGNAGEFLLLRARPRREDTHRQW